MRIRITSEADGRLCLESPYDAAFVAQFKAAIPWDGREWASSRKRWLLSPLYEPELEALCQREGVEVFDERVNALQASTDPYRLMPDDLRQAFACLYLAPNAPVCVAEASYKALARVFHPDNHATGDHQTMERIIDGIATIRHYLTGDASPA